MNGAYINTGNTMFVYDLNSKIYVDKSLIINELNELIGTSNRFICMSRARRFGVCRRDIGSLCTK